MKNKITVLLAIVILASCSAPKYAYYFDHHNYNAGRNKKTVAHGETGVLAIAPESLEASASDKPVVAAPAQASAIAEKAAKAKPYGEMTKTERKAVRQQIKKEIKQIITAKKKTNSPDIEQSAKAMDHDLKLAAIFGAVGIIALIIGSTVFNVIGAIALLIGLVFFVRWLIRQ